MRDQTDSRTLPLPLVVSAQHTSGPTVAQMRARMNCGHRQVLESARDGRPLVATRIGDARGLSTCRATLIGWGAIDASNGITSIGHSLLAKATGSVSA